jgi:peptidoglycan hydrolase-like protein with peptidoglycan-binding domain
VIREVQTILYNLNYSPTRAGRLDDKTRTAIREWQRNTNRPQTGIVDASELQTLRAATLPTTWGAVAFGPRGAFGTIWNVSTRKQAEDQATRECRKGSSGDRCTVLTAANTGCGASTYSTGVVRGTRHNQAFAAIRSTLTDARNAAMEQCRSNAKVPGACEIRTSFCADGSHRQ